MIRMLSELEQKFPNLFDRDLPKMVYFASNHTTILIHRKLYLGIPNLLVGDHVGYNCLLLEIFQRRQDLHQGTREMVDKPAGIGLRSIHERRGNGRQRDQSYLEMLPMWNDLVADYDDGRFTTVKE